MIKILKYLVYFNLFISFSAFILSYGFGKVIQNEKRIEYSLFVFFSTLFLYNFHKWVKVFLNHENIPLKGFFLKNKKVLIGLICFSFIGSLTMFCATFYFNFIFFVLILFCAILSIFYVLKIKKTNLREVPFLKVFIVSIIWTSVLCIIPLLFKQNTTLKDIIFSCIHFFYFFFMTLSFDIRDIEFDKPKMKTFPQVFGVIRAKYIAVLCWLVFYVFHAFYLGNTIQFILLFSLAMYQLTFILKTNKDQSSLFFGLGVDGGILLLGGYYFLEQISL